MRKTCVLLLCGVLLASCAPKPETTPVTIPQESSEPEVIIAEEEAEQEPELVPEESEQNPTVEQASDMPVMIIDTAVSDDEGEAVEPVSFHGEEEEYVNSLTQEVMDSEHAEDKALMDLLYALHEGDYQTFASLMGAASAEAYQFVEKMTVIGFEILKRHIEDYRYDYTVRFFISESKNEYFPTGESDWNISINFGTADGVVTSFKRDGEPSETIIREDDTEENFCYEFSAWLGVFQTADDFNLVCDKDIHHMVHYCQFTAPEDYDWGNDRSVMGIAMFEKYMLETAGLTDFDYTDSMCYNSLNFDESYADLEPYVACPVGHGLYWFYWQTISKDYDEATGECTVIIDYYSDSAEFVVAQTMRYTLVRNEDGTFKMLATELIYDSGYAEKRDSI